MSKINLLPWREERRKERRQHFYSMAGLTLVAGLLVVAAVHFYYVQLIDYQNSRNQFLETQIASLDKKIKEIQDLEKERAQLIARMEAIEKLRTVRPVIVQLFDAIVEALPDGVYLNQMRQVGNKLTLKGISSSNAWVSNFMRNVEQAEWLANPKLDVIQTTEQDGRRISNFTLILEQVSGLSGEDDGEEAL